MQGYWQLLIMTLLIMTLQLAAYECSLHEALDHGRVMLVVKRMCCGYKNCPMRSQL